MGCLRLALQRFDTIRSGPPNVLLIGSGAVGSVVARHLCGSNAIADLLLADVNGTVAKRVASGLDTSKVRAMQLDARDAEALRRTMRDCQIMINTALPRINSVVQQAALHEGLHYVDAAMDTEDSFADSIAWERQGLTALCGMGEDPGIGNAFVRHAANGMDRVDSIKVRHGDTASSRDHPFVRPLQP